MNQRERILAVMGGEMVDEIPYMPRLDLWWLANKIKGTLPEKYKEMSHNEIAIAEGWPFNRMVPDFASMISGPEDILHRAIGLYRFKQSAYRWEFPDDVEVKSEFIDEMQHVEYHTPKGVLKTVGGHTQEMKKKGASLGWTREHLIKTKEDYEVAAYLLGNIKVYENYEGFREYEKTIGENGVFCVGGPSLAASPMHHIQKELVDQTQFYLHMVDHEKEVRGLAEAMEGYYCQVLEVIGNSGCDAVMWGANYDETLTYPPFFEEHIQPWLRDVSERFRTKGIITCTHTDGENQGLMDLIRDCGADVADAVTPAPMTKVTIGEYYRRWRDSLVIVGGISEDLLLESSHSDSDLEDYLDVMFRDIVPGDKIIIGVADSIPPDAKFDRVLRIGERVRKECRLPMQV